jgi:hypothetical protein
MRNGIVIISTGRYNILQISNVDKIKKYLYSKKIAKVYIRKTDEAIMLYN